MMAFWLCDAVILSSLKKHRQRKTKTDTLASSGVSARSAPSLKTIISFFSTHIVFTIRVLQQSLD
ncbi:hypothetical protein DEA98_00545 [Brucella pseudogrignonensis]|uniref:Uncharacterized protein n=1 Tax=Brucella pseudogrignonensis TaxID=419475 RepID=A0A7Y3WY25_9HYPH|nr:hypothetical protein [Brucella pseudogrignonensis]NNV21823.1 hypothetical protein [Brucella pseudogrignonensis]